MKITDDPARPPEHDRAQRLRNFCIIAHIDHGKSTLADRLLELTRTIPERQMVEQVLDKMDLERERGITIKAQAVRMFYAAADGQTYTLNLIDTPGHVDFSYEVSRSLAACEGALLVVDAAQGIEAQTIANAYLAANAGLEIVPVINKIDLASARPDEVRAEIENVLGLDASDALLVSGKSGEGVGALLERIVRDVPAPLGTEQAPLKALIFDSLFDPYRGVIAFVRVVDGVVRKDSRVRMMATGIGFQVEEAGVLGPNLIPLPSLRSGEVGYIVTGLKEITQLRVGDTITDAVSPAAVALSGYQETKPMVFAGLYPMLGGDYPQLRDSLDKLRINDPAFVFEPETSRALGFGFRCGFLGMLHMEIVRERLEREYDQELLVTTPSVAYRITGTDGSQGLVSNPADLPAPNEIERMEEPFIRATLLVPSEYVGSTMELCQDRRGVFLDMTYLSQDRVQLRYDLPLGEILVDFFSVLKARSRGYASFDYEPTGYREASLVRLDILIGGEPVDALSSISPRERAQERGKEVVERLRKIIPRQMYEVPIQAAIAGRVIARETVRAKRKDVLSKCYGGDVTRKRKLLERQKEGKKRMKQIGRVEVPQEAFIAVLKVKEGD